MDKETTHNIIKILIVSVLSLMAISICVVVLIKYYSNQIVITISIETLISLLLAIFSIGISIAFFFKADDTSNKFYNCSYEFMKQQSILLGRIEERFGERLDNVKTTLENMQPILTQQNDKLLSELLEYKHILNPILDKSELPPEEKEEIQNRINKKEQTIMQLQKDNGDKISKLIDFINDDTSKKYLDSKRDYLFKRYYNGEFNNCSKANKVYNQIPKKAINMQKGIVDFSKMSDTRKRQGIETGLFDDSGTITSKGISLFEDYK